MATRSIIGPGFEDWVQTQISVRQNKNKIANRSRETLIYQNTNTSFLSLTSGVNIATGFDENGTPTGYDGGEEAYRFRLYNTRFQTGDDFTPSFASGIGIGAVNTAYGWQSTPDYGFVPPPGLISADIKSLNRGALREATVNLVCHSATQLEIIDQLYLRLGYSMLLEWGNSIYFDNDGNLQFSEYGVDNSGIFLTDGNTQSYILEEIQNSRSSSFGNYDAMYGLVKNFSWNLERDGSYNITLNLVSVGDVIESLKQNTSHPTAIQSETTIPEDEPPLQYNADKSTLNKILWFLSSKLLPNDISSNGVWSSYLQGNQTTADEIGKLIGLTPNQRNDRPNSQGEVIAFLFPQLKGVQGGSGYNAQYYMKLGLLLRNIQNFCLLYDTSKPDDGGNISSLFNINFEEEENFMFTFPRHGSLDPRVCLIDVLQDLTGTVGASTTPNYFINTNYYDYPKISIKVINGVPLAGGGFGDYIVQWDELFDPTEGTPADPFNIKSYGFSFGFESYLDGFGMDQTIAEINSFLQSNLSQYGPGNSLVKKSENPGSGTTTTLENAVVATNSDQAVSILKFYSSNKDVNNVAFQFKKDYLNNLSSGLYFASTRTITAVENKEYLVTAQQKIDPGVRRVFRVRGQDRRIGVKDLEITIDTYRATTATIVNSNTGYQERNVTITDSPLDTKNNLFDNIRPGINFRVDKDKYPFLGRMMNMYINMDYAARTLEKYIDIDSGAISIYDFLSNLMTGTQQALGNVNNFSINYDDVTNTFSIMDSTFMPGLDSYKPEVFKNKPVEFITHTLDTAAGSFVRDASVKSQLSNNFATQVTVGAQANGNVVGENATALSRWNVGLVDRIILEKDSNNGAKDATLNNIDQKFFRNIGLVQNLYNGIDDGNITDQQIEGSRDAAVDLFKYEIGLYTKEGYIPGIGFIPINLELTMDGLSGMRIYESYTADTRLLPPKYKDSIQFIITGISHRIQNNDWTTTITSISGPKYEGFTSKGPLPKVKSHSLKIGNKTIDTKNEGGVNSFPVVSGEVSGNIKPIKDLKQSTQLTLKAFDGLVLVREATDGKRTIGALYYKGKLEAVTVEDAVRSSKIDKKTAIPANIPYNVTLGPTGKKNLEKNYVYGLAGYSGGVFARVGTTKDAVELEGPGNLDFKGIRIHSGTSENSSAGCIIVSSERYDSGKVKDDLGKSHYITRLIYDNKITKLIVINDFE